MKVQLLLVISFFALEICGQELMAPPHPEFSSFQGDAYKMPIVQMEGMNGKPGPKGLQEHYGENIYDYPQIARIDIPELKIPETFIDKGKFPGIERNTQYAMVLESSVKIKVDGCYEFSLNSDDGSILWIEDEKIIDNDGGHQMTLKKDSLVMKPGTYPIKVWYFQSLADRFGCILDARIIGKPEACPNVERSAPPEKLSFNSSVFFDSGSAELRQDAESILLEIEKKVGSSKVSKLLIVGHTDNVGKENDNLLLSQSRAEAIKQAVVNRVSEDIAVTTEGRGESVPIASNDTKEGRQKNRRVEIIIE